MKFETMNLNSTILSGIKSMGYETLTPIQEKTIPIALDNYDVLGLAQTGTGKTGQRKCLLNQPRKKSRK